MLCQHAHGSFASLLLIDYYYKNLNEYNFDVINVQLYGTTTLFFNGIIRLFKIDLSIFSKVEIGLMQEFLLTSTLNENEFNQ